jgi:hypothetical protein
MAALGGLGFVEVVTGALPSSRQAGYTAASGDAAMRRLMLAALLALPLPSLPRGVSPAAAGPPEGVSGRMVFEDVPSTFLADIRAGRWAAAYAQTSRAFQSYIGRTDFPSWVGNGDFSKGATLRRPKPRTGRNCRGETHELLDIGVCFNGEQLQRWVFAWDDECWRFDHISTP